MVIKSRYNVKTYPGPKTRTKIKTTDDDKLIKRHTKAKPRRLAPNPRLYQAPPPRPILPPAPPLHSKISWAPPIPSTALDTASLAALRLAELRSSAACATSPLHHLGTTASQQRHTGDNQGRRTRKHKLRRDPRSSQNPLKDQLDVLTPVAPIQWKLRENRATHVAI
ncbi:unnamed protein product [Parnassius mnemosyne]|uniref:Uncharacterized protein n=1 Tax=Parnassius mnemosyne TaxID=213953 RepID=A0AAV1L1J2_9NEOP